jgi:hypothetical protein
MNIEELAAFSEDELKSRANACFKDYDIASAMTREHLITEAQFYLAEIERRKQAQDRIEGANIADRDYKLELWVIGLIGAELLLAVVGLVFGWVEGKKQADILDKLNTSSAETATTLTAVRQAQEASLETQKHTLENISAMNDALQNEFDLNLLDVLQCSGSDNLGHIFVTNRGKASLFLWGSRFDGRSPVMSKTASVIPYGGSYTLDVSPLSKKLFGESGDALQRVIPYELYLKTANGKKYVGRSNFQIARIKGNLSIFGGAISIARKEW